MNGLSRYSKVLDNLIIAERIFCFFSFWRKWLHVKKIVRSHESTDSVVQKLKSAANVLKLLRLQIKSYRFLNNSFPFQYRWSTKRFPLSDVCGANTGC